MNKTYNKTHSAYDRWSTLGWELLLLTVFNITLSACDKEVLHGSGSREHTLNVSHSLDVSIRGSADVKYKGR